MAGLLTGERFNGRKLDERETFELNQTGQVLQEFKAPKAAASTYSATTGSVGGGALVENRLNNLLDSDSRYIKRARTKGEQYANTRGLLNSSMGAGAAEASAIDSGFNIASQDASEINAMNRLNVQESNKASAQNAQLLTQTSQFNTGLEHEGLLNDRKYQQEQGLTFQGQQHDLEKMGTDQGYKMEQLRFTEGETNARALLEANLEWGKLSQADREMMSGAAEKLGQQYMVKYTDIMSDPDMTRDEKVAATEDLKLWYEGGINLQAGLSGVPISFNADTAADGGLPITGIAQGKTVTGMPDPNATAPAVSPNEVAAPAQQPDQTTPVIQQQPPSTFGDQWDPQGTSDPVNASYVPQPGEPLEGVEPKDARAVLTRGNATAGKAQTMVGQQPQPRGREEFNAWISSPASKWWRYNNSEQVNIAGAVPVRRNDFSDLEWAVLSYTPPEKREDDH